LPYIPAIFRATGGLRVSTDRIEKEVTLRASPRRVWKALTDYQEFGLWFGIRFEGPFRPGATLRGVITATTADVDVAKAMEPMVGISYTVTVERMEPERLFSFRWHPHSLDQTVDYSGEPTTLVAFELEEVDGGTRLRVTESGFDSIPASRRKNAFKANEEGWGMQVILIGKHLERTP
jgi:uncharacterized protein YndB with AHSA1/START domain